MLFRDKLYNILSELHVYKIKTNDILEHRIKERLDKSLENYYSDLDKSLNYLKYRDSLNVLKKMNRG